jgi:membrane fusion protein
VHVLPVLVWVAAAGCVVFLFRYRARRFEVLGLAQGRVHQVAATCEGRLEDLPVELFERVGQGQALAVVNTVLENENLQAQLDTALAAVQHLKAQLAPTRERLISEAANLETDGIGARRRFAVDVETGRLRILELKTQLETDRITLEDLAVEVEIVRRLLDKDAVAPYELQRVQVQYKALATQIEQNEHLLQQAAQDFIVAQHRQEEFAQRQLQHPSVDSALGLIRQEVGVQERRVEELLARRVPLVLKAPFDGLISQIQRRPGEAVLAGEPILTVVEAQPSEVVAYASPEQLGRVRETMAVELVKATEPAMIADSQVVYLGPTTNIPQWGRPLLIRIPPGFELIPGELVGIRGL